MDGQAGPCPGYLHASGQREEMNQDTGSKSPGGLLLKWAFPVPFLGILGKIAFSPSGNFPEIPLSHRRGTLNCPPETQDRMRL